MPMPAPLPALPALPDLPKIPGFEAFGYTVPGSTMSSEGRLQVPNIQRPPLEGPDGGEAKQCNNLPDVLVIDKSQLPKPQIKLVQLPVGGLSLAQNSADESEADLDEELLAQLSNFAH